MWDLRHRTWGTGHELSVVGREVGQSMREVEGGSMDWGPWRWVGRAGVWDAECEA